MRPDQTDGKHPPKRQISQVPPARLLRGFAFYSKANFAEALSPMVDNLHFFFFSGLDEITDS